MGVSLLLPSLPIIDKLNALGDEMSRWEVDVDTNDGGPISFDKPTKKPYVKPTLIKFGTLKQLTKTKGTGPLADGGAKSSTNKTGRGGHNMNWRPNS